VQPLDTVPYATARKQGDFNALMQGHTARFDPDNFFGRNLHSKSELAQVFIRISSKSARKCNGPFLIRVKVPDSQWFGC